MCDQQKKVDAITPDRHMGLSHVPFTTSCALNASPLQVATDLSQEIADVLSPEPTSSRQEQIDSLKVKSKIQRASEHHDGRPIVKREKCAVPSGRSLYQYTRCCAVDVMQL